MKNNKQKKNKWKNVYWIDNLIKQIKKIFTGLIIFISLMKNILNFSFDLLDIRRNWNGIGKKSHQLKLDGSRDII